jgi:hypothetical protein
MELASFIGAHGYLPCSVGNHRRGSIHEGMRPRIIFLVRGNCPPNPSFRSRNSILHMPCSYR